MLIRTLVTALVVCALAAPAALARPVGPVSLDARHLGGSPQRVQDLGRRNAGADTRTSPTHVVRFAENDGTPWTTIALGIGGVCLLLGAAAATVGRTRLRTRRGRIAA